MVRISSRPPSACMPPYREEAGIPVDSFGEFQGRQRLIPSAISHVGLRHGHKVAFAKDKLWKAVGNVGKQDRYLMERAVRESVTRLPPLPQGKDGA